MAYNVLDDEEFMSSLDSAPEISSYNVLEDEEFMSSLAASSYNVLDDEEFMSSLNQPLGNTDNEITDDGFKSNSLASLGIGANNLLSTVGYGYGLVTGDFDNFATQQGQRGVEFYQQFKTPELLDKQRALQDKVDAADGLLAKFATALWGTVNDTDLLGNFLLEQAPMSVPGAAAGRAALALGAGVKAATGAGIATGAGLQASDIGGGVYNDLKELSQEIWNQNPEYRDLALSFGDEQAKDQVSLSAARKAASVSGIVSAVSAGLLPNTVEKAIAQGLPGDGFFQRALKGAIGESLQEGFEEGGGTLTGNIAKQAVDPSQDLLEGVGQNTALGMLGGGTVGGFIGSLSGINAEAERARQTVKNAGGDDLNGAAEAARVFAENELTNLRGRLNIQQPQLSPMPEDGAINLDDPEPLPFLDDPITPAEFDPQITPAPFEPNPLVGASGVNLPEFGDIDLLEEALYADRLGQAERASRLRNAIALLESARTTADADLATRQIDRARDIVGTELSEEFLRQPPILEPGDPLEGEILERTEERPPIEQGPIVATQRRPRLEAQDIIYGERGEGAPDIVYSGSRGTGFATRKGAEAALKSREKAEPRFNWSISQQNSGQFVLFGNRRERREPQGEPVNRYIEQISQDAAPVPVERQFDGLQRAYEAGDTTALNVQLSQLEAQIERREADLATAMNESDDVLTIIRKMGGLQTEEAVAQGIDPASINDFSGRGRPIKKNGISFDAITELWNERFQPPVPLTANDMVTLVTDALYSGQRQYVGDDGAVITGIQEDINFLEAELAGVEQDITFLQEEVGSPLSDDEIEFIDGYYREAFNAIYGQPQTGNAQAPDAGRAGGSAEPAFEGTTGGQALGSQTAIGEAGGTGQTPQEIIPETAPQGAVSTSRAPEFELETYTPADLASRDSVDVDALEARAQIDRERDLFSLEQPAAAPPAVTQDSLSFDNPYSAIKDEEARVEAEEEAEMPSTAPEHRDVDRGISKEKMLEMAGDFRSYMDYAASSENEMTRIFEPPTKGEVVRLQKKAEPIIRTQGFLTPAQAKEKVEGWKENARNQGQNPDMALKNGNKVVLSLFDFTGDWARPWAEAGYEVYTFDVQDDPIYQDVNKFGVQYFIENYDAFAGKDIHAILAACPCTDFSSSGARWFAEKDADGRTHASNELVRQTLRTIEYFKPAIWAIENPVGRIEKLNGLPPWRLAFDPYHFGEDYTKKTLIWGRFNGDLELAVAEPTKGSKMHSQYGGKSLATKNARSEYPEGFPYAFFNANNQIDHPIMAVGNKYDMIDARVIQDALDRGLSEEEIDEAVGDAYYGENDYEAAEAILRDVQPAEDEGQEPSFQRQRGATRRPMLADEDFNSVIGRIVGENWQDDVIIVDTFSEVPPEIIDSAAQQGSDGGDVTAVFHKGKVYVVRGKMQSKYQLERSLLHEGTHGGIAAMYGDKNVKGAMNRLWAAMGGQKGFDKLVKEFGIEDNIAPYADGLKNGRYTEETRNSVLVQEMLAYVGERGSKGIKQKALELLGAIRAWLKNNGFLRLAKLRASDIALMAKQARNDFLRNRRNADAGQPQFTMDQSVREKPQVTDLGLYSNAEKILLDEGAKIFKASKKNPEGQVRGDQIVSFLKGRMKPDEFKFVFANDGFDGDQKYTREQAIDFLRDQEPMFEETVGEAERNDDGVDEENVRWSEGEVLDSPDYWEHYVEDLLYAAGKDDFGQYGIAELVGKIIGAKSTPVLEHIISNLDEEQKQQLYNLGGIFPIENDSYRNDKKIADIVDELGEAVVFPLIINYDDSLTDEAIEETAYEMYLNDPLYEYDLIEPDVRGSIRGNDDQGYYGELFIGEIRLEIGPDIYDLGEAKVQALQLLMEYGEINNTIIAGDTLYGDHLKLEEDEAWDKYREFTLQLDNNKWGTYRGGHFGGRVNTLYNVLATDRRYASPDRSGFPEVFVIEEMQSDWHSDIRKGGGPRDQEKLLAMEDEAAAKLEAKKALSDKFENAHAKLAVSLSGKAADEFKYATQDDISTAALLYLGLSDSGREFFAKFNEADFERGGYFAPEEDESRLQTIGRMQVKLASIFEREYKASPLIERIPETYSRRTMSLEPTESSLEDYVKDSFWVESTYQKLLPIFEQGKAEEAVEVSALYAYYERARREHSKVEEMYLRADRAPPDTIYQGDKYLDLALKRSVTTAIEEGKDAIAFSVGDRVQQRWSDRNDYSAIYDGKIRKAAEKLIGAKAVQHRTSGDILVESNEDEAEFWLIPLSDEFKAKVQEDGLPMFQREGRVYPKKQPEETLADLWIRKLQDKMLPLKRTQQRIVEERGRQLDVDEDPYMAEELFYGKTEEDLRQLEVRLVNPFINALEEEGISLTELDAYLYARHAKERNDYIASINEALQDGGSGMTNAEAAAVLDMVEKDDRSAGFKRLAAAVDDMTTLTRDLMREGGLITDEQMSSYNEMYKFYVPLRGFADGEVDSSGNRIPRGKGYDVRGKESMRALGRTSKAQSPTSQVIADLTSKTIRARKNEVGQTFLEFVEQNPDPDFWEVFTEAKPDRGRVFRDGKVLNDEPMSSFEMAKSPDYFAVKRDGIIHYIKIKDQGLLASMQNLGPEKVGAATKVVRPLTRFLATVNTSANPQFIVTNFSRDITAAVMNVLAEETALDGKINGEKIALKVAANTPKAVLAIRSANKEDAVTDNEDPEAPEYRKYYQDFLEDGAKTGYFDTPEVDEIAAKLEAKIRSAEPGAVNDLKKIGRSIGEFVEKWNTAVENGVRLSAYIEARKAGVERARAASLAKNLTVNFNRKGELGAGINSWYMFFNAAVQGTAQFTRTLSPISINSKGKAELRKGLNLAQKIAGGITIGGIAFAQLMREVGGEDDDGEAYWDKIPLSVRERNLIIMKPGSEGDYYKFPLPYGYNFFWNIGDSIEALMNGSKTRKEGVFGGLVSSFFTSFSPVSMHVGDNLAEQALLSASPSVVVPLAEIAVNKNFFGDRIYPENFPGGAQKSDAALYYPSTNEVYVELARWMNEATGGSDYKSGWADVSPETLAQIIEYAGGGLYRTFTGAADSVARPMQGRKVEISNVPFARILMGRDQSDYTDRDLFYDRFEEIKNARAEYRNATTADEQVASDERFNRIRQLYPRANNVYKILGRIRDDELYVRDNDDMSAAERDEQLESLRELRDDYIDDFNRTYNDFLAD